MCSASRYLDQVASLIAECDGHPVGWKEDGPIGIEVVCGWYGYGNGKVHRAIGTVRRARFSININIIGLSCGDWDNDLALDDYAWHVVVVVVGLLAGCCENARAQQGVECASLQ